jgi:hypothetical protein
VNLSQANRLVPQYNYRSTLSQPANPLDVWTLADYRTDLTPPVAIKKGNVHKMSSGGFYVAAFRDIDQIIPKQLPKCR